MTITWKGFAGTPDGPTDYWHCAMINDLIARIPEWVDLNLLVTPGHFRDGEAINEWIGDQPVIVWILGDEEGDCPFWEVRAPVWKQFPSPHVPYWPDRILPLGYTPHTRGPLQALGLPLEKSGWVFAGQNTNNRRAECVAALFKLDPDHLFPSPTFAGGLDHEEYMKKLWEAEWAPSPAGNVRADSFRMWEALEAGAVPLVDATSPHGDRNVWPDTLGEHPLPVIASWHDVADQLSQPAPLTETAVWYTKYKRNLVARLVDDWYGLMGTEPWPAPVDRITSIITASPLPSHPDFEILRETVESVRSQLKGEICVAFDGPREPDPIYEEHIRRVAWYANQYWPEVWIHYTGKWKHQAGTLKDVLPQINTGALLVLEADTPITGDLPWNRLVELVYNEDFNHIRLHYDDSIHPEHEYLMRGRKFEEYVMTVQYSQRPHIVRTPWYSELLSHIPDTARTYVEDVVYGWIANSPWDRWKLGIYAPKHMKRSYHLDGREGIPKGDFWFD